MDERSTSTTRGAPADPYKAPDSMLDRGGFVEGQVRRVSRNLILWNGAVIGLVLILAWFGSTYYYNFFRGPLPVDDDYLLKAAAKPASGLIAYVQLQNRELIPTGYVEKSSSDGHVYSTIPYFFLAVGDKQMLVKTYSQFDGARLIGPLQSTSVKSDLEAFNGIVAQHPEMKDKILPIMLNGAAAYNVAGYIGLGFFVPILLLCGFNIGRASWGLGSPALHPVARALARFGDPIQIAEAIDKEIATGPVLQVGKATVSSLWLLRPTVFGLLTCQLADIVWAYHLILNGDSMAVVAQRNGKAFGIPLKKDVVPRLLTEIYTRVPWVQRGYDLDTLKRWQKQKADFIAAVDQRRQQQLGSPAPVNS